MRISMHVEKIESYFITQFNDVYAYDAWGERSFFLNPQKQFKRGTYFATLKMQDGEHDTASHLNREGIFRVNMGLSKDCYKTLLGELPKRPPKGGVITNSTNNIDFTVLNTLLPHPVYAWMGWVCVLNPDESLFRWCKPLFENAYNKASLLTMKKLQHKATS